MKNAKKFLSSLIAAAMLSAVPGVGTIGGVVAWAFEATPVDASVYAGSVVDSVYAVEDVVYGADAVEDVVYAADTVEDVVYNIETVEDTVYNTVEGHVYYEGLSSDIFALVIGEKTASVFGVIKENDVAPIIRNDRTMLPARFVAENLGATVEWDNDARVVTVKNDTVEIKLTIDSAIATVNGVEETLDSPAFIENDRTYTPVRFIAEKLGATVDWNQELTMVIIKKAVEEAELSEEEAAALAAEEAAKKEAENAEAVTDETSEDATKEETEDAAKDSEEAADETADEAAADTTTKDEAEEPAEGAENTEE